MLVPIWVSYALLHYYFRLISDSLFNLMLLFTIYGIINYSRINFNKRYLLFGEKYLVYGTKNLTVWHIPLNKICRIEKVSIKGQYHSSNLCTEKVAIYTTDNDSFELYNVFNETDFIEIESELREIVASTNKAITNRSSIAPSVLDSF